MSKSISSSDRNQLLKELPDFHLVRKTELIFRALNHKLRQQILLLLLEHKQLTVTELFTHLRLEQSVASQHLATLRRTGFVATKKEGKYVWYMLNPERLAQVEKAVALLNGGKS
jgi:DNA-binding transcriptional ArsR family regulator